MEIIASCSVASCCVASGGDAEWSSAQDEAEYDCGSHNQEDVAGPDTTQQPQPPQLPPNPTIMGASDDRSGRSDDRRGRSDDRHGRKRNVCKVFSAKKVINANAINAPAINAHANNIYEEGLNRSPLYQCVQHLDFLSFSSLAEFCVYEGLRYFQDVR